MRTVAVVCAIAASALIGPSVRGDIFDPLDVDQYQNSWSTGEGAVGCFNVGDPTMMAQTFTPSVEGTLYGIEIGMPEWNFGTTAWLTVEIYEGQPNSNWTSLASFILPPPTPSTLVWHNIFQNYHINSPVLDISVDDGTVYSIVLSANGGTAYVGSTDYDSYVDPAGALWESSTGAPGSWSLAQETEAGPFDMQFRTYVQPVPLPAGVLLGVLGLSVAGWRLKRQQVA